MSFNRLIDIPFFRPNHLIWNLPFGYQTFCPSIHMYSFRSQMNCWYFFFPPLIFKGSTVNTDFQLFFLKLLINNILPAFTPLNDALFTVPLFTGGILPAKASCLWHFADSLQALFFPDRCRQPYFLPIADKTILFFPSILFCLLKLSSCHPLLFAILYTYIFNLTFWLPFPFLIHRTDCKQNMCMGITKLHLFRQLCWVSVFINRLMPVVCFRWTMNSDICTHSLTNKILLDILLHQSNIFFHG